MTRSTFGLALSGALLVGAASASAGDWIFQGSYYSHDPQSGERTAQYQPIAPVMHQQRLDYLQSGYRQDHIRIGGPIDADNIHIVEEWGRPVRPYGEWLHPYRPYSVPYQLWGPPYGGLGGGGGWWPQYQPGFFPPGEVPYYGPDHGPGSRGPAHFDRGRGHAGAMHGDPPAKYDGGPATGPT